MPIAGDQQVLGQRSDHQLLDNGEIHVAVLLQQGVELAVPRGPPPLRLRGPKLLWARCFPRLFQFWAVRVCVRVCFSVDKIEGDGRRLKRLLLTGLLKPSGVVSSFVKCKCPSVHPWRRYD